MDRGFSYPGWVIKQTVVQSAVLLGSVPIGAMMAMGFAGGSPKWILAGMVSSGWGLYAAQWVHTKIAEREAQVEREALIAEGFLDEGAIARGLFFRYTIATMVSMNLMGSVIVGGWKVGNAWEESHKNPPVATPAGMEQK